MYTYNQITSGTGLYTTCRTVIWCVPDGRGKSRDGYLTTSGGERVGGDAYVCGYAHPRNDGTYSIDWI